MVEWYTRAQNKPVQVCSKATATIVLGPRVISSRITTSFRQTATINPSLASAKLDWRKAGTTNENMACNTPRLDLGWLAGVTMTTDHWGGPLPQ